MPEELEMSGLRLLHVSFCVLLRRHDDSGAQTAAQRDNANQVER